MKKIIPIGLAIIMIFPCFEGFRKCIEIETIIEQVENVDVYHRFGWVQPVITEEVCAFIYLQEVSNNFL